MDTGTLVILVIVLCHLIMCLIALKMILQTQVWISGKKAFAVTTAIILIIFGPILIILAIKYLGKSGASNPDLKNSEDLL